MGCLCQRPALGEQGRVVGSTYVGELVRLDCSWRAPAHPVPGRPACVSALLAGRPAHPWAGLGCTGSAGRAQVTAPKPPWLPPAPSHGGTLCALAGGGSFMGRGPAATRGPIRAPPLTPLLLCQPTGAPDLCSRPPALAQLPAGLEHPHCWPPPLLSTAGAWSRSTAPLQPPSDLPRPMKRPALALLLGPLQAMHLQHSTLCCDAPDGRSAREWRVIRSK